MIEQVWVMKEDYPKIRISTIPNMVCLIFCERSSPPFDVRSQCECLCLCKHTMFLGAVAFNHAKHGMFNFL